MPPRPSSSSSASHSAVTAGIAETAETSETAVTAAAAVATSTTSLSAYTSAYTSVYTSAYTSSATRPSPERSFGRSSHGSSCAPGSRRRTRESSSLPTDHLLKPPIVLKPYPSGLTTKPRILQPLMLLPRENLPLSALHLSMPHGDFPDSRFYESQIKILDLEGRLGSTVLLARAETSRAVYAIERGGDGLYALCMLGPWVDLQKLACHATAVCSQRLRPPRLSVSNSESCPAIITPNMYKESKKKRLAIEEIQSMVRKRPRSQPGPVAEPETWSRPQTAATSQLPPTPGPEREQAPQLGQPGGGQLPTPIASDVSTPELPKIASLLVPNEEDTAVHQTAEDHFQNIRTQCLEALYHSMGSLAYFAKGPLSRARAAFHPDSEPRLNLDDLSEFLQTLVVTTVVIDKKYRETVPAMVANKSFLMRDLDEKELKSSRKKKAKKVKLGKDGLYSGEDRHVRQWWLARQKTRTQGDDEHYATPTETKFHISCLRTRETHLQMILILEILALESLRRSTSKAAEGEALAQVTPDGGLETSGAALKKRNKHNFPVLLDLHADRLCIWQSTATDEIKALAESQIAPAGHHVDGMANATLDPLRDFCVDIIVPFFSARLPELCDLINRKLGGPVIQSQAKEKAARPAAKPSVSSSSKHNKTPGAAAKRPSAHKKEKDKNKTLEQVLDKERMRRSISRGPSGAIALLRSASATAIPGLKREPSEQPSLAGMAARVDPGPFKENSGNSLSRTSSWDRGANTDEVRARKQARVDSELREAISALKKPNRAQVGREIVDEVEKRHSLLAMGVSQPKKITKTSRASTVQVKATPTNNRFKDVLGAEAQLYAGANHQRGSFSGRIAEYMPSNSSAVVPASTAPCRVVDMLPTSPAVVSSPSPCFRS